MPLRRKFSPNTATKDGYRRSIESNDAKTGFVHRAPTKGSLESGQLSAKNVFAALMTAV